MTSDFDELNKKFSEYCRLNKCKNFISKIDAFRYGYGLAKEEMKQRLAEAEEALKPFDTTNCYGGYKFTGVEEYFKKWGNNE